ncbi:MAG TPA: hypothetical protein VGD48_01395 [Kutzneria sp.]
MRRIPPLATTLAVGVAAAAASVGPVGAQPLTVPDGITAGIMVFDRHTHATELQYNAHQRFRSASLVKLLIALDYLETNGTDVPPEDLAQLQPMLRSSDDDAASYLWVKDGWETIVRRMVAKIGLTYTAPPVNRGIWGYTAVSAADVVKIYDYILTGADPAVRDFIMGNLRRSTKCGNDGFGQSFGIPGAVHRPWAVKQGWSGFGAAPAPDKGVQPGQPRAAHSRLRRPRLRLGRGRFRRGHGRHGRSDPRSHPPCHAHDRHRRPARRQDRGRVDPRARRHDVGGLCRPHHRADLGRLPHQPVAVRL